MRGRRRASGCVPEPADAYREGCVPRGRSQIVTRRPSGPRRPPHAGHTVTGSRPTLCGTPEQASIPLGAPKRAVAIDGPPRPHRPRVRPTTPHRPAQKRRATRLIGTSGTPVKRVARCRPPGIATRPLSSTSTSPRSVRTRSGNGWPAASRATSRRAADRAAARSSPSCSPHASVLATPPADFAGVQASWTDKRAHYSIGRVTVTDLWDALERARQRIRQDAQRRRPTIQEHRHEHDAPPEIERTCHRRHDHRQAERRAPKARVSTRPPELLVASDRIRRPHHGAEPRSTSDELKKPARPPAAAPRVRSAGVRGRDRCRR